MAATIRIASCLCLVLGLFAAARAEQSATASGYYYYPPYPYYEVFGPYGPPPLPAYRGVAPPAASAPARSATASAAPAAGAAPAPHAAAPVAPQAATRSAAEATVVRIAAPAKPAGGTRYPAVLEGDLAAGTLRAEKGRLGPVLADPDGRTLYISTRDPQGASSCTNGCTRLWRPFLIAGTEPPTPPFGAVARPDGTSQWSHAGRPLYLWSGDSGAGDVTGDGVDGAWFALRIATPNRTALNAPGADPRPTP